MKIHVITIGQPKLSYAREGWDEYWKRLGRYHEVRATHLHDKYAADSEKIMQTYQGSYVVVLEITGKQAESSEVAAFLEQRALDGREVSFIIGGPDGLPQKIREAADCQWSLSKLTLPHDLAMVTLLETLYRASTINAGHPYHR